VKQILTSSQTVGPFFHNCLLRVDAQRNVLASPEIAGQRIRVEGHVYDGDNLGVPDAVLEVWQANSYGRYNHPADQSTLTLDPAFHGYGRFGTDASGAFWFETIKPGRVRFDDERLQAPHICVAVFARGLLNHLLTRLYFADDPANVDDPVLQYIPIERRSTLLAQPTTVDDAIVYRFDIVLQNGNETVFFNIS
jgi:protocatechuate 3,4-dioxygenase, alpha subunit